MARGTIKQRIALEGGDKLQADLENLGKAGEEAFAKIKAAGDKAGFDKTQTSAKNLKGSLDQMGASAQSLGQRLGGAFGNFAHDLEQSAVGVAHLVVNLGAVAAKATAAIGGIALAAQAAATKMANLGSDAAVKIQDAADALGLTTDAYQKLTARAAAAGVAQSDIEEAFKRIDKLATAAAASVGGFSTSTQTIDGATVRVIGYAKGLGEATAEGKRAAEIFKELGLRMSDIAKASPEERINLITAALAKMPESAKRNALALELLGNSWRKTIAAFSLGKGEVKAAADEFDASTRQLSKAQIALGVAYDAAKKDLVEAIDATLQKIGLLFAPGATKRAEWLTKLVDDTRPATLAFAELVKQKAALFAGELSGPNGLLKQGLDGLIEASKGLSVIWTSALAPALKVIHGLIGLVTEGINQLLGTKLTAKQAEILVVVGYLVGAFGLLKLAIDPVLGLIAGFATLLVALGPILIPLGAVFIAFWDEIKAGGEAAFAFLESKTKELKTAFQLLLKGDYKGAWAIFSKLGIEAFDKIKAAATTSFEGIASVFQSLRTAILFVRATLEVVANVINGLFGTHLTGTTLGVYLAFFKLAGILGALGQIIPIVNGAVGLLGSKFIILAAAALVIYRLLPDLQKLFSGLGDALTKAVNGDIAGSLKAMGTSFSQFWAVLKDQSASTWIFLSAGAIVAVGRIRAVFAALGAGSLFAPLLGGIRTGVTLALTALAGLVGWPVLLVAAFTAAAVALGVVFWEPIKAAATVTWQWVTDKASAAWAAIQGFFSADSFAAVWEAIKTGAADAWQWVQDKASAAWEAVKGFFSADALTAVWEGLKQAASDTWDAIKTGATDLGTAVSDALTGAIDTVKTAFSDVVSFISNTITSAVQSIKDLIDWIQQAGQAANDNLNSGDASSSGTGANFGSGFASGGHVRGRGTSTSDSIPAWLSDYEFVVQAKAVRKYGLAFLQAVNSGRLKLPGFASGGLAKSVQQFKFGMPAFSGGGLATLGNPIRGMNPSWLPSGNGMVPANIHIPGHAPVPVMASSNALQQLARAAGHKKLTTGGTKPSWYK